MAHTVRHAFALDGSSVIAWVLCLLVTAAVLALPFGPTPLVLLSIPLVAAAVPWLLVTLLRLAEQAAGWRGQFVLSVITAVWATEEVLSRAERLERYHRWIRRAVRT
jgi:hypothetical protein